jgi:hypothetical protein|nr:MAG TPA: hypothetical protein [Caudoviricetes sp.]
MENVRFPHRIIISRAAIDQFGNVVLDDNGKPEYRVVLESVCGIRTQTGNVQNTKDALATDYKLALPRHSVDIQEGDMVELYTYTRIMRLVVKKATTFNFGSNIWANESAN